VNILLALYLGVLDGAEDKALFEKLYITYRQPMLYRARAILENDTDAEDAVHEVFFADCYKIYVCHERNTQ